MEKDGKTENSVLLLVLLVIGEQTEVTDAQVCTNRGYKAM